MRKEIYKIMPQKIEYLVGQSLGNCIYLGCDHYLKYGSQKQRAATFKCQCGKEFIAILNKVKRYHTKSCGCIKDKNISELNLKHGHAKVGKVIPEFNIWWAMISRCNNIKNKAFKNYGGKGVKVCDRWANSFENFYADMGNRPTNKHTLDRFPNKYGNYEPANCRWATMKEQQNNRTNNLLIEYNGDKKTLSEWSEILKFNYATIYNRIKVGWSIERAFETPILKIA